MIRFIIGLSYLRVFDCTGVYGLSDAVTEVRVCKRKIASRDKHITKLQEQLAECYVEIERLSRNNEQLTQGLLPSPEKVVRESVPKSEDVETEKTILALEEEILTLKQSLRELQRSVVDNVHKASSDWSPLSAEKRTQATRTGSSDEENLDRCQISLASSKKVDSQDTDGGETSEGDHDKELENQRLKEFLVQILESLQKINNQKSKYTKGQESQKKEMVSGRREEEQRVPSPTPAKRLKLTKELPKDMRYLRHFVSEVLQENQKLSGDLHMVRKSLKEQADLSQVTLFESAQQQVLRQRSLIALYTGVLVEQLAYVDALQETYRRQLRAVLKEKGPEIKNLKARLSHKVNFDFVADLRQQIHQLNKDIVSIKSTMVQDEKAAVVLASVDDQTENLFMLEKLRMQVDALSKQHLKTQTLLAERESELMQMHEKLQASQPPAPPMSTSTPDLDRRSPPPAVVQSDDDDATTIQEESQTESERSVSHSFYRKLDSLKEYNRKLCSELSEAQYILKRTQDALKIKDVMLKEVNRQQIACGNLEQKIKVMEISLDTTKKLLGHKEQTLERYRQLVTDLKLELVSVKVKCTADIQQMEKSHMNEMYQAKKQIAEITMKTFHNQQLALDNDAVHDQRSFEKMLAEKQVQIVQLQNKVKTLSTAEFKLSEQLEQANESNQRLRETFMEAQERIRALERSRQAAPSAPPVTSVVALVTPPGSTTPAAEATVDSNQDDEEGDHEKEISDLREKLSSAQEKINRLKSSLDDAKQKISEHKAEIDQQTEKIEQLRKIQSLRRTDPKRVRILEGDNDSLRRQLYELKQQRVQKSSEDLEKQTKQNIEVARWDEAKKWQSIIEGLKEQLKEKNNEIERLEAAEGLLRVQVFTMISNKTIQYHILHQYDFLSTLFIHRLQYSTMIY